MHTSTVNLIDVPSITFGELLPGAMFQYDRAVYMKIDPYKSFSAVVVLADVTSSPVGTFTSFSDTQPFSRIISRVEYTASKTGR